MPIEASVIAENKFVEVGVDVPSAEAVIGAERPSLHEREDAVDPRENDMPGGLADDARIVPVTGQPEIGMMAVREQRGPGLDVGLDERMDGAAWLLGITASRIRPENVSGYIVAAFGGALFHLPGDTWWTYLGSLVIYVLCGDLYRYWWHRMYHIVPALWAVHSFHHSAEAVTFVTGARFHWLNRIIDAFFPLFAIIVQVPHSVVLAGIFIYFLPDGCAHLNVRFSLGRFVMWINSPQYHRIHHSTRPEHFELRLASSVVGHRLRHSMATGQG